MPVALVTGVSGYLASHIAKILIERGYDVRGTVRDLKSAKARDVQGLFPSLKLYEADLLKEGSFDQAVAGCDFVFHAASPFILQFTDPERELIQPAVNGTKNVLGSIERVGSKTVKRVIQTSSVAAVLDNVVLVKQPFKSWNEEDWNTSSTATHESYRYSKVLAERTVHELSVGKPWKTVSICPSFIIGPPLFARADGTSIEIIKSFLDGSKQEVGMKITFGGMCDVRDVALGHVLAAELPNPKPRYMVNCERGYPPFELVSYLRRHPVFGKYPLPTKENPATEFTPLVDNSRCRLELGVTPRHPAASVVDMAQALVALGIVTPPK